MTRNVTSSDSAQLARLVWMMIGPMVLFILAFANVMNGGGWFTAADVAFLAVLAGTICARWWEFRAGDPQTAEGDPATPAHFRRYLVFVAPLGVGVWIVANLIGNHWLAR